MSDLTYIHLMNLVWFSLRQTDICDLNTMLGVFIGFKYIANLSPKIIKGITKGNFDTLCKM